ncbi:sensor histidine kinase [Blastococcus sp. VKM Ac-2987]|uniref:sensor histidine kinase n=1 Tax=Blastococcus sp. VKM Ac-2987 TaxID=3004141 RepID=UPI0022AB9257|nr:ATP-binding protein [Blastococcus sp. VKM Ac-2987]MCZ2857903.1 histidine kinase [Blastococcus sp. VKM Ac-2987]
MATAAPPPWYRRLPGSGHARELTYFAGAAVLALIAVSTATVLISERIARSNALEEVERTTVRIADLAIGPLVPGYLNGSVADRVEFERAVANRLRDPTIESVVIWDDEGRVVYSSRRELIGERFPLSDELRSALAGTLVAEVADSPETAYEGNGSGPALEVYAPLSGNGRDLVLEVYYDDTVIERQASRLRGEVLPMALGGLVLLQLVQFPIAASLARRVRRNDEERTALADAALVASERERRAIAADLHDGPVQDLAGVSYALSALRNSVPEPRQAMVDRLAGVVRTAVASLRRVMLDVYPPDLSADGLPRALDDLVLPLQEQGLTVDVRTGPLPPLGPQQAATLYRTAKEALANVAHHAQAQHVWVSLEAAGSGRRSVVALEVADDGVGFPSYHQGSPDGHLGLKLSCDRVLALGGRFDTGNRPGGGARVAVELPVDRQV